MEKGYTGTEEEFNAALAGMKDAAVSADKGRFTKWKPRHGCKRLDKFEINLW